MNTNLKKAILVFGGGFLLYWAFTKIRPIGSKSKKSSKKESVVADDDTKKKAATVLVAYKQAVKDGQNKAFLNELNSEAAQEYGLKVYNDKTTGRLFVADLEGNKVI